LKTFPLLSRPTDGTSERPSELCLGESFSKIKRVWFEKQYVHRLNALRFKPDSFFAAFFLCLTPLPQQRFQLSGELQLHHEIFIIDLATGTYSRVRRIPAVFSAQMRFGHGIQAGAANRAAVIPIYLVYGNHPVHLLVRMRIA
jgi:hypothetical protein